MIWGRRDGRAVSRAAAALLAVSVLFAATLTSPVGSSAAAAEAAGQAAIMLVARGFSFLWVADPQLRLTPTQADMERGWVVAEGEAGIQLWALTLERKGMTIIAQGQPGSPQGIPRGQVAVKSSTPGSLATTYQFLTSDVLLWRTDSFGLYPVTVDVRVSDLWQLDPGTWSFTLRFIAASN